MLWVRATRTVRGIWPDRNPLRRRLDRIEAAVVGVLVAAFLAGAPLAALATRDLVLGVGSRVAAAEQSWHQVPATLLESAPAVLGASARASWQLPDGARHSGRVPAPPGARAGSTVRIWVDGSGRLASQPVERAQVRSQAVLAAVFAVLVLGCLMFCLGSLAHMVLDQRRLEAWDLDWRLTGPRWTRQR